MRNQIKALDAEARKFGGYLIPFGSPEDLDLDGEYFAAQTKAVKEWFDLFGGLPLMFHHEKARAFFASQGLDLPVDLPIEGPIGKITSWKTDDMGHYVEGMLGVVDSSRKWYEDMVWKLIQDGKLFFSSGALPQRLKKPRKDGLIPEWVTIEGSVTPTPANPKYTNVISIKSVKSALDQIGVNRSLLDSVLGDGESSEDGESEKAESVDEANSRIARAFQAQDMVRSQLTGDQAAYVVDMLTDSSLIVCRGHHHFKVAYTETNGQLTFASPDQWIPVKREWVATNPVENAEPAESDDMAEEAMGEDEGEKTLTQKRALALLELESLRLRF